MKPTIGVAVSGGSRRLRLAIALVVAAVVLAGTAVTLALRPDAVEPRQVLLLIVDTARRDAFGCYGAAGDPTPNCDELAADGVRFDQAVSVSGWTLPSVGSLLTGTWPTVHGGEGKGVRLTPIRLEIPTAAEVMRGAGFHTMAFANAAFLSPLLGLDRGFDVFDHHYTFNQNYRLADATVEAAAGALEANRQRANFLVVHLFDPHLDYGAPDPFTFRHTGGRTSPAPPLTNEACRELVDPGGDGNVLSDSVRYVRGLYQGEVSFADAQIGRLVRRLKNLGLYENTLIIVTADHGEEFWEHGGFEHGHTLYDELVHVPLIVKYPARFTPDRRVVATQVRSIDVMPTVFDWFGIRGPETFVGESLTPLAAGAEETDRDAFLEGTLYGDDRWALRGPQYKYVLRRSGKGESVEELFDRIADPGETEDLSKVRPVELREQREKLAGIRLGLETRVSRMAVPRPVYLGPDEIEMLRSLGYMK